MAAIQKLPASVVNKIAAGEVIERPASVLKELLENAVDAGASRVDVAIEQGGAQLIRVSDNGCGIAADQLPLAVSCHATSKIQDADDLFQVQSLGFRGEALASIAEVSQLVIRSRVAGAEAGAELEVRGGQVQPLRPCGCPVGTTVEVRNLFFNTPVRRKFLRTTQTEFGHVTEAFTRVAIAQPRLHAVLEHNQRTVHELPPVDRWLERIGAFFGSELGDALIWVDNSESDVRICGYVADPSVSRGNNRMQYLLLNGRHIRDRSLQHALGEAYRGLLLTGRFPVAFLRLDMPPSLVDVNVHPAKLEVRFADGGRLYSQLLSTLRSKFLTTDLTARAQLGPERPAGPPTAGQPAGEQRPQLAGWGQHQPERPAAGAASDRAEPPGSGYSGVPPFRPFGQQQPATGPAPSPVPPSEAIRPDRPHGGPPRRHGGGLQIQNRYLVTEDDQGMVVIDQHALHERILYEQLRERVLAGPLESQRLLVPEPVALAASELAAVLELRQLLKQLGIEVEPFGGDTILVSSYPAMLANFSPADVLQQIVERVDGPGPLPERRELLDQLLHLIACKAAIKAGDRLAPEEVAALLEQRHLFQDTHHCPHGRPTALVFTNEELDKRFKRV
jgi:DNA mismatch repair protein MutL